ncbi:MAG: flippase-like domain-containing protein [Actinobacteria bacterium]|nr:flippase-like domain-containing protein [Actinomycetota bacterium]
MDAASRRPRSRGGNAVRTTFVIVVFLFIVFYLVLPQWAAQRDTAEKLQEVNPVLIVTAFGLEIAALIAYSILTRVTLPEHPKLSLFTIFRIQLATRAVTNVVPGGSAAGSTLGFRLFTQAGVPATAAGFSMATVGIGSAVVLNLILWVGLVISIPLNGFKQAYVGAALIGVFLLAAAGALVWTLMEGRDRAERVLRAIARRIPFVHEDTMSRFVHQLADRLHDLISQPELVRKGAGWAAANWLIDAASLWVFLRAFGASVDPIVLIVAYGVAQVAAAIPITPGGLGVVEAALPATLTGFGVPPGIALAGVLSWRFAQFWMPIPLGGLSYLTLRFGRVGRGQPPIARVRRTTFEESISRRVWDDETGEYRWTGSVPVVRAEIGVAPEDEAIADEPDDEDEIGPEPDEPPAVAGG